MISLILNCSEEKKKKNKQTKPGQEAPFKKKKNKQLYKGYNL